MGLKDNLRKNIKTSLNKLGGSGGDVLAAKQLVPTDLRTSYNREEVKEETKKSQR